MFFLSPGSIGLKTCSEYQFCNRLEAAIDNFGNIIRFQSSMYGWDEIIKWKKKWLEAYWPLYKVWLDITHSSHDSYITW